MDRPRRRGAVLADGSPLRPRITGGAGPAHPGSPDRDSYRTESRFLTAARRLPRRAPASLPRAARNREVAASATSRRSARTGTARTGTARTGRRGSGDRRGGASSSTLLR